MKYMVFEKGKEEGDIQKMRLKLTCVDKERITTVYMMVYVMAIHGEFQHCTW